MKHHNSIRITFISDRKKIFPHFSFLHSEEHDYIVNADGDKVGVIEFEHNNYCFTHYHPDGDFKLQLKAHHYWTAQDKVEKYLRKYYKKLWKNRALNPANLG